MANYRETDVAGVSWVRCRAVTIINPIEGTIEPNSMPSVPSVPTAYFQEEKVISIDGVRTLIDSGSCSKKFNATEVINLRNPDTGELTGVTSSHAELYSILYSLYLQTAIERDEKGPTIGNP